MAHVRDSALAMGRVSSTTEFAEVNCTVDFSGHEVEQNLTFALFIPLFEIDDEMDAFHWQPNGLQANGYWLTRGVPLVDDIDARDDFVRWLSNDIVRPNGNSTRKFTRRAEFDIGEAEGGEEEYKAFVWVIPEITEGAEWTNTLSVDLG